jgi:cellulose synthase/poly-beta-1,6-N-acetylglucosamine synthase-like glycosyltransferase
VPISECLADIRDPRVQVIRHPRNRGVHAARNAALRVARSPLVSQLDSDDVWKPNYLEALLPHFDDPDVGLVYSNVSIRHHPEGRDMAIMDPTDHPIDHFPRICDSCPIPSATPTMRTDAVRAAGGYAEWLRMAGDYHLYLKLAAAGWRFVYLDETLATYSWHETHEGLSFDSAAMKRDELKMWLAFMARHPLTPGPRRRVRIRLPQVIKERLGIQAA